MLAKGNIIKFNEVIEAVAESIASVCINADAATLPPEFDNKVVKSWTVTRQEIVTNPSGYSYIVNKTTKYNIILNSNITIKQYNKTNILTELNKIIANNSIINLKNKGYYVATFLHFIKLLLKYIKDSVKIYVSPYYNSRILVFSPSTNYKYDLPVDISYEGDSTYTEEQLKEYINNIAELTIYSLPEDNIIALTYSTSIEKNALEEILLLTIKTEFIYTEGYTYAKLKIISDIKFSFYFKKNNDVKWTQRSLTKLDGYYQYTFYQYNNTNTTYYFKIVPSGESLINYKILGDDNTFGFKFTKTTSLLPYTYKGQLEYLLCAPNADTLPQSYTSDGLPQYLTYPYGKSGYNVAKEECKVVRPNGWIDPDTETKPTDAKDSYWRFTYWYSTKNSKVSYRTVTTWSGEQL